MSGKYSGDWLEDLQFRSLFLGVLLTDLFDIFNISVFLLGYLVGLTDVTQLRVIKG